MQQEKDTRDTLDGDIGNLHMEESSCCVDSDDDNNSIGKHLKSLSNYFFWRISDKNMIMSKPMNMFQALASVLRLLKIHISKRLFSCKFLKYSFQATNQTCATL